MVTARSDLPPTFFGPASPIAPAASAPAKGSIVLDVPSFADFHLPLSTRTQRLPSTIRVWTVDLPPLANVYAIVLAASLPDIETLPRRVRSLMVASTSPLTETTYANDPSWIRDRSPSIAASPAPGVGATVGEGATEATGEISAGGRVGIGSGFPAHAASEATSARPAAARRHRSATIDLLAGWTWPRLSSTRRARSPTFRTISGGPYTGERGARRAACHNPSHRARSGPWSHPLLRGAGSAGTIVARHKHPSSDRRRRPGRAEMRRVIGALAAAALLSSAVASAGVAATPAYSNTPLIAHWTPPAGLTTQPNANSTGGSEPAIAFGGPNNTMVVDSLGWLPFAVPMWKGHL